MAWPCICKPFHLWLPLPLPIPGYILGLIVHKIQEHQAPFGPRCLPCPPGRRGARSLYPTSCVCKSEILIFSSADTGKGLFSHLNTHFLLIYHLYLVSPVRIETM